MKTKVTINGVEYSLDLEKAKKLGILKEKDARCKSWEEFKEKHQYSACFYFNTCTKSVEKSLGPYNTDNQLTQDEASALAAFSKLLKLRRDWIGEWNPDWENAERKYCIVAVCNRLTITSYYSDHHTFSFPTEEMAKEFLKCFGYLFEQCKYLI